jgi:hypothetical protein
MATTADEYYITDATATLELARMIVSYQDGGGGTVSEYGNLNAALTSGIQLQVRGRDGSTVKLDLLDGETVQTNGDWARFCYDANRLDWGSGDDYFVVRWTFAKSGEALILEPGQRLSMVVQDDLSLLTNHFALVQGIER